MKVTKKIIFTLFLVIGVLCTSIKVNAENEYYERDVESANTIISDTNIDNLIISPTKDMYRYCNSNENDFCLSGYIIFKNEKINVSDFVSFKITEDTRFVTPKDGKIIIYSTIVFPYNGTNVRRWFYSYVDETLPEDKTIIDTLNGKTFTYKQYKKKSNTEYFTLSNGDKIAGNIKYWKKENGKKVECDFPEYSERDYGIHKVNYTFTPKNDNFQEVSGTYYVKIPYVYDKSKLELTKYGISTGIFEQDGVKVKIDNKWYKCDSLCGQYFFKKKELKIGSTHKVKVCMKIDGKYKTLFSGEAKVIAIRI